eukprot:gnl/TRDRNA2_/TRDRNA2_173839_c0_seq4.p1 gnl/TRDRNA2_/TRDRNA2_173839_c0~~gnl/TRDRNA2_/TRDRNA2_173839_c0_seq4.p1  ORF type:complete len:408 (-),score=68.28 gnl/TRDRNA2_/TRDRNA2_173839_c0_seq4:254-1384(-)
MEPAARSQVQELAGTDGATSVNVAFGAVIACMQIFGGAVDAVNWSQIVPTLQEVFSQEYAKVAGGFLAQALSVAVLTVGAAITPQVALLDDTRQRDASQSSGHLEPSDGSERTRLPHGWRLVETLGCPATEAREDPEFCRYIALFWCSVLLWVAASTGTMCYAAAWMGEAVAGGDASAAPGSVAKHLFVKGAVVWFGRANVVAGLLMIAGAPALACALESGYCSRRLAYAAVALGISLLGVALPLLAAWPVGAQAAFVLMRALTLVGFVMRYDLLTVDSRFTTNFASSIAFMNVANCLGQSLGSVLASCLIGSGYVGLFVGLNLLGVISAALLSVLPDLCGGARDGAEGAGYRASVGQGLQLSGPLVSEAGVPRGQ